MIVDHELRDPKAHTPSIRFGLHLPKRLLFSWSSRVMKGPNGYEWTLKKASNPPTILGSSWSSGDQGEIHEIKVVTCAIEHTPTSYSYRVRFRFTLQAHRYDALLAVTFELGERSKKQQASVFDYRGTWHGPFPQGTGDFPKSEPAPGAPVKPGKKPAADEPPGKKPPGDEEKRAQ